MATPTVTISVSGVPITATTTTIPGAGDAPATDALYMMYVQAVKGDVRHQWVVFPPARTELGVDADKCTPQDPDTLYLLQRVQQTVGNRSKWFHHRLTSASTPLVKTVSSYSEDGYEVQYAVAVPLEADDYKTVWNTGDTPHKALRAVDRALKELGLSVK